MSRWLIVFPDPWIAYSPSCLNFIKMIEEQGEECIVIAFDSKDFDNSNLTLEKHDVFIDNSIVKKIFYRLNKEKAYKILKLYVYILVNRLNTKCSQAVGFDDVGYIVARLFHKHTIYYSLEVCRNWYNRIIFKYLVPRLLIIQSTERKEYLLKDSHPLFQNVAYIQNSPVSQTKEYVDKKYNNQLLYLGTVIKSHGVEECINLIRSLELESLTIKGLKISDQSYIEELMQKNIDLIEDQRLFFDFEYIQQGSINEYLKNYSIGFCFYDLAFKTVDDFNYLSSPSGKMFNYFQNAIPTIGVDFIGLSPVHKFKAGVLLSNYSIENLIHALEKIKRNYEIYSANAFKAGQHYDYRRMFLQEKEQIFANK